MELLDGLATKVMLVKQVMQVSLVHLWINFRVIFSLDDIWTEIEIWWRRPKPFMINIWKITFIA